jgi:hypothetical protein
MALSDLGWQRETGRIFQAAFSIESGGVVGHTHNNPLKSTTSPASNAFSGVQRYDISVMYRANLFYTPENVWYTQHISIRMFCNAQFFSATSISSQSTVRYNKKSEKKT